eukprot:PhF_6_TR12897/c0_g1_i1/m.20306
MNTKRLTLWLILCCCVVMVIRVVVLSPAGAGGSRRTPQPAFTKLTPSGLPMSAKPWVTLQQQGSSSNLSSLFPTPKVSIPLTLGPQITSAQQMSTSTSQYIFIKHARTGMFLARPLATTKDSAEVHEKVWKITYSNKYKAYRVKSHTRTYLACELTNRVSVDRVRARSFEQWFFHFESDHVQIQSRRSKLVLGTFRGGRSLQTTRSYPSSDADDNWLLYQATHCATDDECFGKFFTTNEPLTDRRPFVVPVFGSPKPLEVNNTLQTLLTVRAWEALSSIPHVKPVIFANDDITLASAQTIRGADVEPKFEIHSTYHQPTYRGLFQKAFDLYDNASVVVYTNSDILYTRSLVETIHAVAEFYNAKSTTDHPRWKGFMIIGQRTNIDVPKEFRIQGDWESQLRSWELSGETFESDAEDYFVVSRGLFDWHTVPDFVVGGVAFDNWLVNKANVMGNHDMAMVVDGTKTITAIHQNHCNEKNGNEKCSHAHPKSDYNRELASRHGGWTFGKTTDVLFATERTHDGKMTVFDKHKMLYP